MGAFEYGGSTHLLFKEGEERRVVRVDGRATCLTRAESEEVLERRLHAVETAMVEMATLRSAMLAEQPVEHKTAAKEAEDMRRAQEVDDLLKHRTPKQSVRVFDADSFEFMPDYTSGIVRSEGDQQRIAARDARLNSEVDNIR